MKVAGYLRVSTEEQAREGFGLGAQETSVRGYCQARGWELVDIYIDAGRSGKSVKGREGLARMMADAQTGAFQCIIFVKLDRLARKLKDLLDIWDFMDQNSIAVVCIDQSIDTTTSAGRLMRNIFGSVAEFERDAIVDRIEAALAQKARQGEIVGPLPVGYKREYSRNETGKIISYRDHEDPVVAPLIRAAFERYATGQCSMRDLAAWSIGVGLMSSEGNPLDRLSVRKLLSNETYSGVVVHRGEVVAKGKHPAIVDVSLFQRVQEIMRNRNRRYFPPARPFGREPYPLSGTANCDHCTAPLVGVSRNVSDKFRYSYYRCSTSHRRGRQACPQPMIRAPILEDQIKAYVGDMRLPPEYLAEVVEELRRRQARPDNQHERAVLLRQQERWRSLYVLGEIDEVRLKMETAPLKARLAEIEQPPEVLDMEAAVDQLRDMGTLWSDSPRALQRSFVREVFQHIGVQGADVTALTPKPQYAPLFILDRQERFGQVEPEFCRLAPGTGFEPVT